MEKRVDWKTFLNMENEKINLEKDAIRLLNEIADTLHRLYMEKKFEVL